VARVAARHRPQGKLWVELFLKEIIGARVARLRFVVDRDIGVPVPLRHRQVVGLSHHLNVRDQVGARNLIVGLGDRHWNIKPVLLV